MPALSTEEMAAVLDDTSRRGGDEDDDAVLESQLLANISKNKTSHAVNSRLKPIAGASTNAVTDATRELTNGASHEDDDEEDEDEEGEDEEEDEEDEILSAKAEEEDTGSDSSEADDESSTGLADGSDAQPEQNVHEGIERRAEMADHPMGDALGVEQDDDEYEDATSNLEKDDMEDAEQSSVTSPAEAVEESDFSESEDDEDAEDLDLCIFCAKPQPDDTSKEEVLTCKVCRKPAHRPCARSQEVDTDTPAHWRCPSCTSKQTSVSPNDAQKQSRQSAPRLVRDLLPVSRGMQKPGAHSIFAQPLIADDEGGRALRKRRSDGDERIPGRDKRQKQDQEAPKAGPMEPEPVSQSTRRASQKIVLGLPPVKPTRILQHRPFHKPPPHKFILAFKLDQSKIEAILSEPPRPSRRRYLKKKQKIPAPPPYQPPVPKFPALPTHTLIFPSMFGDRENDTNAKPYGGILSEAEAETSRSLPQMRDREIFELARKEAEEERKKTSEKAEAEINGLPGEGSNPSTSKRTVSGPPSKIKCIQFGKHVIDTSYAAPYPEEYSHESRLFICEFCLKYLPSEFVAWRHKLKCPAKHPPGDEIYRDGTLSIWEVDGRKKTEYCQCLCLMAKLFLGSKTLYYDVDPFLFYILTEYDEYGYHFVGYFSKEKRPASQNNVSCILVMPIHQRKGYATFLIEFSYLLTRIEKKEGSPEKPLSDMGLTAYRSYWDLTISRHLLRLGSKPFSVKDIMELTGMTADDVVHSLERLYAFVRDPITKTYAVRYDKNLYESIVEKFDSKEFRTIKEERLVWTPYIMGRSDAATLDAQPITAVAQREEDVTEAKPEVTEDGEDISPKTSHEPTEQSPSKHIIDPALINNHGNIAPGPPSTDAMDVVADTNESLVNGHGLDDKGKASDSEHHPSALSGYALIFEKENIPPTRFQIDPPIPPSMIRYAKSKRKSMGSGTPRPNGRTVSKPSTPQALRHSPRKAGSINGRSSRASTPGKENGSIRRSGRRSGLAHELEVDEDDDDEDVDMDDGTSDVIEVETEAKAAINANARLEIDASSSEEDEEEEEDEDDRRATDESSESGSEDDEEADEVSVSGDSASSDPDVAVDNESASGSASASEEEQEDEDAAEVDVPSPAVSSAAVSDASASEVSGSEEEEEDNEEEEEEEEEEED